MTGLQRTGKFGFKKEHLMRPLSSVQGYFWHLGVRKCPFVTKRSPGKKKLAPSFNHNPTHIVSHLLFFYKEWIYRPWISLNSFGRYSGVLYTRVIRKFEWKTRRDHKPKSRSEEGNHWIYMS